MQRKAYILHVVSVLMATMCDVAMQVNMSEEEQECAFALAAFVMVQPERKQGKPTDAPPAGWNEKLCGFIDAHMDANSPHNEEFRRGLAVAANVLNNAALERGPEFAFHFFDEYLREELKKNA